MSKLAIPQSPLILPTDGLRVLLDALKAFSQDVIQVLVAEVHGNAAMSEQILASCHVAHFYDQFLHRCQ